MTDADGPMTVYRSRDIVESFLQNVVVLDDLAVMPQPGKERPDKALASSIVHPDYPESSAVSDDVINPAYRGARLNADKVINAFAEIGLVCAVLDPAPNSALEEGPGSAIPKRITRAAVRADIVVLDWKIRDSAGEVALGVMKEILADDQDSHRLRLMAIYTGEPNLDEISEKTKTAIQDFYKDDRLEADNPSRISKGSVRVVILAKEGTISGHSPSRDYPEVKEGKLHRWLLV